METGTAAKIGAPVRAHWMMGAPVPRQLHFVGGEREDVYLVQTDLQRRAVCRRLVIRTVSLTCAGVYRTRPALLLECPDRSSGAWPVRGSEKDREIRPTCTPRRSGAWLRFVRGEETGGHWFRPRPCTPSVRPSR